MLNVAKKRRNSAYLGVALLIGGSGFFSIALNIYKLSSNPPSPHLFCKNVLGFIGGSSDSSYTITREGELDLPGRRGQNETKSRSPRTIAWRFTGMSLPFVSIQKLSHKPGLALWIYTYRATFPAHFSAAVEHCLTRNLKFFEDGHGF